LKLLNLRKVETDEFSEKLNFSSVCYNYRAKFFSAEDGISLETKINFTELLSNSFHGKIRAAK
jgi:hypothetical protein